MNMDIRLLWDMNITKLPSPHLLCGDIINVCKQDDLLVCISEPGDKILFLFNLLHPFPELETNNPTVFIQALVFNLSTCSLVYTTINFVRYNFRYSIKVTFSTFNIF